MIFWLFNYFFKFFFWNFVFLKIQILKKNFWPKKLFVFKKKFFQAYPESLKNPNKIWKKISIVEKILKKMGFLKGYCLKIDKKKSPKFNFWKWTIFFFLNSKNFFKIFFEILSIFYVFWGGALRNPSTLTFHVPPP